MSATEYSAYSPESGAVPTPLLFRADAGACPRSRHRPRRALLAGGTVALALAAVALIVVTLATTPTVTGPPEVRLDADNGWQLRAVRTGPMSFDSWLGQRLRTGIDLRRPGGY